MQGGIDPQLPVTFYADLVRAVRAAVPGMHVHAFSPMEIVSAAAKAGVSIEDWLTELRDAGLGSIPGTAAEILDDEVRWVLTKGKLPAAQWVEVVSTAHRLGIPSSSTMMYGHVDEPRHWLGHLRTLAAVQDRTGGFTEFVPLPFVHHNAPIYLAGLARPGPTERDNRAVHAFARLALHGRIDHMQVSWVKLGDALAADVLRGGADDMGGTLMEETISRMAGSENGSARTVSELTAIAAAAGRPVRQRSTTYREPVERLEPAVVRGPACCRSRRPDTHMSRRVAGPTGGPPTSPRAAWGAPVAGAVPGVRRSCTSSRGGGWCSPPAGRAALSWPRPSWPSCWPSGCPRRSCSGAAAGSRGWSPRGPSGSGSSGSCSSGPWPASSYGPPWCRPECPTRSGRGLVALVVVGWTVAILGWGAYRALGPVPVRERDVQIEGLGGALDGLRIVQITDTHLGPFLSRRWAAPDHRPGQRAECRRAGPHRRPRRRQPRRPAPPGRAARRATARDARVFITGNHEYYSGAREWTDYMCSLGWTVLRNRHVVVRRGMDALVVAGIDDRTAARSGVPGHGADLDAALAGAPAGGRWCCWRTSRGRCWAPSAGSTCSCRATPTAASSGRSGSWSGWTSRRSPGSPGTARGPSSTPAAAPASGARPSGSSPRRRSPS